MLWTIKRYKELQAKQAPSVDNAESAGATAAEAGSTSNDAQQQPSKGEDQPLTAEQQKEARSRLIAERHIKLLAQMQNAQKSFMKSNAEMFASSNKETNTSSSNLQKGNSDSVMDWEDIPDPLEEVGAAALLYEKNRKVACLGPRRSQFVPEETSYKCILCFADCNTNNSGPPLVSSAFLQTSRVIYTTPNRDTPKSLHVSCCGHVMHYSCWKEYYSSEETKEVRRPQRNRGSLNQGQNEEFHCPYCRTLSNTVLPVSEPLAKYLPPTGAAGSDAAGGDTILPLDSFVEVMRTLRTDIKGFPTLQTVGVPMPKLTSILEESNINLDMAQFERDVQIIDKPQLDNSWNEVMDSLHKAMRGQLYGKQNKDLPSTSDTPKLDTMLLWDTCSYTLQALEVYLFVIEKPLKTELPMRHQSCASNLVRTCALYSSILMQSDMASQHLQAANLLDTVFNQVGPSVLEWDCFRMLVQLNFAVPNYLIAGEGEWAGC